MGILLIFQIMKVKQIKSLIECMKMTQMHIK